MSVFHPSPGHSIWLRPHAAMFVYLPKVACTSWKLHLAAALQVQPTQQLSYATVHNPDVLPLPYLARLTASEREQFEQLQQSSDFRYYTVMRDPRERAVSAYLDKILFHANPQSFFSQKVLPSIQDHIGLTADAKPTFEQFLRWIQESPDSAAQNDHWCPMSHLLGLRACRTIPDQWIFWPMSSMPKAVSAINSLLAFDQSFPSREALGSRPNRQSRRAMNSLISEEENRLLNLIYCDDITLYDEIVNF